MYILNGCISIFRFTSRGLRSIFLPSGEGTSDEQSPLLHSQHSLTSSFVDYEHSNHALRTCLLHTLTYYILVVVLFSFVVEKWDIVDSLYFATVLVRIDDDPRCHVESI